MAVRNAFSPVPSHFGGGVFHGAVVAVFFAALLLDRRGLRRVVRASMNNSSALGRMRTERPIRTISMSPEAIASSTVRRQVDSARAASCRVSNDAAAVVDVECFCWDACGSIDLHPNALRQFQNCRTISPYCPQMPGTAETVSSPPRNVSAKMPPRQFVSVNSTSSPRRFSTV